MLGYSQDYDVRTGQAERLPHGERGKLQGVGIIAPGYYFVDFGVCHCVGDDMGQAVACRSHDKKIFPIGPKIQIEFHKAKK